MIYTFVSFNLLCVVFLINSELILDSTLGTESKRKFRWLEFSFYYFVAKSSKTSNRKLSNVLYKLK